MLLLNTAHSYTWDYHTIISATIHSFAKHVQNGSVYYGHFQEHNSNYIPKTQ